MAEAVIGAAYITMGREVALKVTKALNVPVPHIDRWTDFARKTLAPPPEAFAPLKSGTVEHLERAVGHPFRRPHLLAQALVRLFLMPSMHCFNVSASRPMSPYKDMKQQAMNAWSLSETQFWISVCFSFTRW